MIITNKSAIEIHEFLSEKLNTNWLAFMESAYILIPSLSQRGRIPANKIAESFLHDLNFPSWKSYITASKRKGGLGWSINGWNNFRRAYNLIKLYPYLKEIELSAGWINNFSNELRKKNIDFPITSSEFYRLKALFAHSKESQKDDRIIILQAALDKEKENNKKLNNELSKLKSWQQLTDYLDKNFSEIGILKEDLSTYKNFINGLGFFTGIKLIFGCNLTVENLKYAQPKKKKSLIKGKK